MLTLLRFLLAIARAFPALAAFASRLEEVMRQADAKKRQAAKDAAVDDAIDRP